MRDAWAAEAKAAQHLPSVRVQGPLLPLLSRLPADVVVEVLEVLAESPDPDHAHSVPRSSFLPFFRTLFRGLAKLRVSAFPG